MKSRQLTRIHIFSSVIMVLCFSTALATTALPQGQSRPSPVERRNEHMTRQREQHERDTLRGPDGKSQKYPEPSQAAILQVRQDFEQIQTVYNQIVLAISDNRLPEYRLILDATGEIRKCAGRLKKHLALPVLDDNGDRKEKSDLKEEEIRPSLQSLCLHIAKFVTNPIFESKRVIDIEESTKASKDLEEIIELSEVVWRSVDKLAGAKK